MARQKTLAAPTAEKKTRMKKSTGTGLVSMSEWEKRFAAEAAIESEKEKAVGGDSISTRNGKFSFKEQNLGTSMEVIILNHCFIRTWYDQPFDPDSPSVPACYSVSLEEIGMTPAENAVKPQCDTECNDCQFDAWDTGDKGKGKACKEGRRLILLSADKDLSKAERATLHVPSASLKNWKGFFKSVTAKLGRPLYSLVVKISFDPDAEYDKMIFEVVEAINDPSELSIIDRKRNEITDDELLRGYDPEMYVEPVAKKKPARTQRGVNVAEKPAARGRKPVEKPAARGHKATQKPTDKRSRRG